MPRTTTTTRPTSNDVPETRIPVRRVAFDFAHTPRYWYAGEPSITAFAYALSGVFPEGERFFIDSVRHFRERIESPRLQKQVKAFAGQEAQHSRVHELYNAHAESHGFAVSRIDAIARERLAALRETMSPSDQLALTCALEHFTAMMAEQLLGNPRYTRDVPTPHAALWRWHAAEEAEHKAVAFDVYQAVDGDYRRRIVLYVAATFSFALGTGVSTLRLLAHDGRLLDVRSHAALVRFLFVEPGLVRGLAPQWFEYFRRDFHPRDRDDSELLARWEREWAPRGAAIVG